VYSWLILKLVFSYLDWLVRRKKVLNGGKLLLLFLEKGHTVTKQDQKNRSINAKFYSMRGMKIVSTILEAESLSFTDFTSGKAYSHCFDAEKAFAGCYTDAPFEMKAQHVILFTEEGLYCKNYLRDANYIGPIQLLRKVCRLGEFFLVLIL
jgi:hypothetical protein